MDVERSIVSAGLNPPERTIGLSGLSPFEILELPPVKLKPEPGVLRLWVDLPPGTRLDAGRPIAYRVFGGEAGLEFERNGQIVRRGDVQMPLELSYEPRAYPEPPPAGQLALELSFAHRDDAGNSAVQDVQWRQTVVWDARGTAEIEWRFQLQP